MRLHLPITNNDPLHIINEETLAMGNQTNICPMCPIGGACDDPDLLPTRGSPR